MPTRLAIRLFSAMQVSDGLAVWSIVEESKNVCRICLMRFVSFFLVDDLASHFLLGSLIESHVSMRAFDSSSLSATDYEVLSFLPNASG